MYIHEKISVILIIILAGIVVIIAVLWNKPHAKVENSKGIRVAAVALNNEFSVSEQSADKKYLNKAIEVTGVVNDVSKNQDGGTMIYLETGDPLTAMQCAMRNKGVVTKKGDNVIIKGFCSGYLSGVSLTDCIILK